MIKIAAMGDNVVDCYLSTRRMYPGGNCLNVATFVRRFGAGSTYVGAIGDDAAGDAIQSALTAEGIDTSRLRVLPGMTAYCIIGHHGADRVFLRANLGVSMFEPLPVDLDHIANYDAVHIGQSSGLDDHVGKAAAVTSISYDFSTRRDADHSARIAPNCFLASISGGDAAKDDALGLLRRLLAQGARWVLVTRGRKGALLSNGSDVFEVDARPVKAVDTLGAGDTFIARTLFGLLSDEHPRDTMQAAAIAAGETCRYHGAIGHGTPLMLGEHIPELDGTAAREIKRVTPQSL